jgi:hypothetical protein
MATADMSSFAISVAPDEDGKRSYEDGMVRHRNDFPPAAFPHSRYAGLRQGIQPIGGRTVVAEVFSAGPIGADRTKPDNIELGDDATDHRADLERLGLGQAFGDGWNEIDATEAPSFRPLSRGMPSPHRATPTPRCSQPSAEPSPAAAPLPFGPARALSAGHASLQAGARATSSHRGLGGRRILQRSFRPLLAVCFFIAGAVAGLGGGNLAATKRIIDGTIEQARIPLSTLTRGATWRDTLTGDGADAARTAPGGAAANSETAAAAIVMRSDDGDPAHGFEGRGASVKASSHIDALPRADDVPPLSAGGAATEMASDSAQATAVVSRSVKNQSARFALTRGDEAMRQRDVIAARRFYEFAASAGVAGAATAVARTYDPFYLRQVGVRGVQADVETASRWYKRASEEANAEASRR